MSLPLCFFLAQKIRKAFKIEETWMKIKIDNIESELRYGPKIMDFCFPSA